MGHDPVKVPARAGTPPAAVHHVDALTALHETGRTLAGGGTVEAIVRVAVDLVLAAIPVACRAELRVTRRDRIVAAAVAGRPGHRPGSAPPGHSTVRFPLRVQAGEKHGAATTAVLSVSTTAPGGLDQVAASTLSVLAGPGEAALAGAVARELAAQLRTALAGRTTEVAVGILTLTHGLTRDQAVELLRTISRTTDRNLARAARAGGPGPVRRRPAARPPGRRPRRPRAG